MAVIFLMSMQDAASSSRMSGGLSNWIARQACSGFDEMDEQMRQAVLSAASYAVRKVAHLTEYAILGALFSLLIRCYQNRIWLHSLLAFAGAVLYAATDELHQLFSEGRAARLLDVGIDSLGAACGILAVLLCLLLAVRDQNLRQTP